MAGGTELAEHATGFCVAAMGLVMGGAVASTALVPMAVLTAMGLSRIGSCDTATVRRAREGAIAALTQAGEISDADASAARDLLKSSRRQITFEPARMVQAVRSGNPMRSLMTAVFDGDLLDGEAPGVVRALELTLAAAFEAFRSSDSYQGAFTQEIVLTLLKEHGVLLALARETRDNTRQLLAMIADMQRHLEGSGNLSAAARKMIWQEDLVLALARRYAEGTPDDFDGALRGLERALEVAAEERTRLPSNLGEAVNAVVARVKALNDRGRIDQATAELKAALLAQEEREAEDRAATDVLLYRAVAQATIVRSVPDAAAYTLKRADRVGGTDAERLSRLRAEQGVWYVRGRDQGLAFDLEVAIALARESVVRARDAEERGTGLNDLGNALSTLGEREAGTARLEEAVEACRAALEEMTREHVPLDWARTQMSLGNALSTLGRREAGTARLEEAVEAYRAALEEMTREHVPLDWARTQMNLGAALSTLGRREAGTARLEEAVEAYRAALKERTRERAPLDWAMTQMNLGAALSTLGEREAGTARLEEAVEACRAALKERTREHVPLDWARTQMSLGNALSTLGEREAGTARLEEAVEAYRAALEEMTRERVPLDWATTQMNLGAALSTLGEREAGTARLEEAVEAYRAALEERTRERAPLDWAMTQCNIAFAELAWARQLDASLAQQHIGAAEVACRAALEVFHPQHSAYYHSTATASLQKIEAALARLGAGDWP